MRAVCYRCLAVAAGSLHRHLDAFPQAVASLRANPLRSALAGIAIAAAVGTLVLVDTAVRGLALAAERSAARTFGSDTLAVVAYNFARDERLGEAALPSLAIVAVGLIPVLLLTRAMRSA